MNIRESMSVAKSGSEGIHRNEAGNTVPVLVYWPLTNANANFCSTTYYQVTH